MLKVTKSRFYLVPVLMHTLDIHELLSESSTPVRRRHISVATGISQTTTYRILRTLVHRGYVNQDLEGGFSLTNQPHRKLLRDPNGSATGSLESGRTDLSGDEVIHIVDSILQALRNGDAGSFVHAACKRPARIAASTSR